MTAISQYRAILLELPQLVDINFYCHGERIISTLFGAASSTAPPLPNLEKLYTSCQPHRAEYEAVISNAEKYPTVTTTCSLPLPTDVSDPLVGTFAARNFHSENTAILTD